MTLIKSLKKLIKNTENKEMAVKHVVYYLFNKKSKNENIDNLLLEYKFFYFDNLSYLDLEIDKLIEKNKNQFLESTPGDIYENITTNNLKKSLGQVYTPKNTIMTMIEMYDFSSTTRDSDNKIIDISCGSGYFLIPIIEKYVSKGFSVKNIVKNLVYGVDKDEFSVFLTKLSILLKYPELENKDLNIFQGDILFDSINPIDNYKFDLIIGNPPYIGHKNLSKNYKEKLYKNYNTYTNKSDISFCFFEKGYRMLKENGKIIFITSRYFMEGQNSFEIRKFLKNNYKIERIVDYNGSNLFKGVNISPLIIKLSKEKSLGNFNYSYLYNKKFHQVDFNQRNLKSDKWIIRPQNQLKLLRKLYSETQFRIKDFIEFKQGIITGLDKAFVVTDDTIKEYSFEKDLLKSWIKNSNIYKDHIINVNNYKLIYSKDIDINLYPKTKKYLTQFKSRLEKRRECKKGIIKWYELQWPRKREIFEKEKIIFPYKAKEPTFFNDKNNFFCSADVYIGLCKDKDIKYENLVKYLNSKIFKFICSIELKKVGKDLYEFYPYALENLPIINKTSFIDLNLDGYINYEDYLNKQFRLTKEEINIINSTT
jgi:adenine-specific DNA-methyltransferase